MPPLRVLIVDDHETVRKALRRLLAADGWDVCGEAAGGGDAIAAARTLRPDVILMDLFMPGMSGIAAARQVLSEFPAIAIVLLTTPDPDIVEEARRTGIRGTVAKASADLVGAVRAILGRDASLGTE
jgi:DNA-binding NarL/FixJ family response regulator